MDEDDRAQQFYLDSRFTRGEMAAVNEIAGEINDLNSSQESAEFRELEQYLGIGNLYVCLYYIQKSLYKILFYMFIMY